MEGVIKFHATHQDAPIPDAPDLSAFEKWRPVLQNLGLIGQIPDRYGGFGFGNVSMRWQQGAEAFVITGTQTSGKASLHVSDYAKVIRVDIDRNELSSLGLAIPSSEAMTHGAVYQALPQVNAVVHVHCPVIWQLSNALALPAVSGDIAYGTPEMARAIVECYRAVYPDAPVVTMLGHEDGILAAGVDMANAMTNLLRVYHRAILLRMRSPGRPSP